MIHFVLTGAVLHNICQHDDLEFDVSVGLNAITGRNGDGKSNLLRALAYGLTGMVDGTWGSQQDLQKDGTADPGYVIVKFTDGISQYSVRRFSTSGTKFQDSLQSCTNGEWKTLAVRRQAVNRQMEEFFGIPIVLMFQIMWGRQGELDHLLTAPAAYVNSFLTAVFDTGKLEKLRTHIKNALDTVAQLPADSVQNAESKRRELAELESEEKLSSDLTITQNRLDELNGIISGYEDAISGRPGTQELERQKESNMLRIHSVDSRLAQLTQVLQDAPQKPGINEKDLAIYIEKCRDHGIHLNRDLRDLENRSFYLQRSLERFDTATTGKQEELDALIARIDSEISDRCELCGHQLSADEKALYTANKIRMISGCDSIEALREKYAAEIRKLHEDRTACETELAEIPNKIAEFKSNIEKAQQELQAADVLRAVWTKYNACRTTAEEFARLQKESEELHAKKDELDKIVPVSEEDMQKLNAARAEVVRLHSVQVEQSSKLARVKQAREMLIRMVEDAEKAADQYQINTEARNLLNELRDIFSQRRAQSRYLRSRIAELNERIAVYMSSARMPFQLYLNDTTHVFEYSTAAGYVHPASRLSGAQRSISAVVLQMSILDVVAPRMNLFLVDEPSEALDPENKIIQAGMFAQLSTQMPDIDGTMLIVTRDEQLIDSCNNNIKVSK